MIVVPSPPDRTTEASSDVGAAAPSRHSNVLPFQRRPTCIGCGQLMRDPVDHQRGCLRFHSATRHPANGGDAS